MKTRAFVLTILSILIVVTLIVVLEVNKRSSVTPNPEPVACTMDAMVCPDGSAVGRVGPNCEFAPCPEVSPKNDLIRVTSPASQSVITSPVTITGMARGTWFFEGSFPISIVNWDGLIVGEGVATAQGEWMTEDFVPFTASITYTIDPQTPYNRGTIILRKDNPSGLPEHDDSMEVPVMLSEISE